MIDPNTEIEVAVHDGQLVVRSATQDMGTGSKTVLAKAVAEVFERNLKLYLAEEPLADTVRAGRGY